MHPSLEYCLSTGDDAVSCGSFVDAFTCYLHLSPAYVLAVNMLVDTPLGSTQEFTLTVRQADTFQLTLNEAHIWELVRHLELVKRGMCYLRPLRKDELVTLSNWLFEFSRQQMVTAHMPNTCSHTDTQLS